MARSKTTARKKTGVSIDLSKVGKSFEDGQEYLVKCVECTLEEGDAAPYFALKFEGTGDFAGAVMYHNASTAEKALWRLRPLVEAFGIEIPDGPMDLAPEDFIGKFAMCSVYKDRYDGKVTIKPEDFWAAEDHGEGDEGEGDEGGTVDLDDLDDDDIKKLAKAAGIKGTIVKKLKAALAELDPEELAEAAEEAGIGGAGGDGEKVTADAINEMSQDELEALVEEHELEVDLDEHKTLRKKRSAVVDAAEEAGILAED